MPKKKTHKGAAKRFKVTGGGKIMHRKIGHGHLLEKKNAKRKRRLRSETQLRGKNKTTVKTLISS